MLPYQLNKGGRMDKGSNDERHIRRDNKYKKVYSFRGYLTEGSKHEASEK